MIDDRMRTVLDRMEQFNKEHHETALAIPPDEGLFLHMQVLIAKPKRILELGMSTGYSTVRLAGAARTYGGGVETVEFDKKKIEIARKNFSEAGVEDAITILNDDANAVVDNLKGDVDFVFMDTEKEEYLRQFKAYWPHIVSGGAVYADNAVDLADKMADYFAHVKQLSDGLSVTNPIGNGLEITLKL